MKMNKYIQSIKENKYILILFTISLIFFLFQHHVSLMWDFSAYVLNAKYLFSNGTYFEVYRSPLASILLAPSLIFGLLGEYLFITLVAILFFYANIKLADAVFEKYIKKKGKNKDLVRAIFYFFSLSIFVLRYGTLEGTELLGLAFLEIFLAAIINKKISGHFLGLAFLARYNFIIFSPLLFFSRDYKKIIKNVLSFLIITFPWFLFNYLKFGNWFTSVIDSYALNIYLRDYLIQPFNILEINKLIGWFWPFLIIGVILSLIQIFRTKNIFKNKKIILFILVSILILIDINKTPLKITRYLFNLSLPIAFFSTIGLLFIKRKFRIPRKTLLIVLIILFIITTSILFKIHYSERFYYDKFSNAAKDIKDLEINHCEILSPHWVPVTYYTENVYPLGRNDINRSIDQNKIILIFKEDATIDDLFNISNIKEYPVLLEKEKYIFLAKKNIKEDCSEKYIYNSTIINNHCEILSIKFQKIKLDKLVLKACNLINKN